MAPSRFRSLEGFTLGALLAGALVSAVFFAGDRLWPSDTGLADLPTASDEPDATTPLPGSSATAEPPDSSAPATPPGPAATEQAPTGDGSGSPQVPSGPVIDPGICSRPVSYLGVDLPVVDEDFAGGPLGRPASLVFTKQAAGHPADDPANDIYLLDGDCDLEYLLRVERGEQRTVDVESGQWVVVTSAGTEHPGSFPAGAGVNEIGLG